MLLDEIRLSGKHTKVHMSICSVFRSNVKILTAAPLIAEIVTVVKAVTPLRAIDTAAVSARKM